MTYHAGLSVASGTGRLARRADALLFIPEASEAATALVDAFLDAELHALDEVLAEHVLARSDVAPGFVAVMWPGDSSSERLKIVVRGAASISSDIASVPELSGAGSSTWVEHRVVRNPPSASIHSGDPAVDDTDFRSGVITAGGFRLTLAPVSTAIPTPTSTPTPVAPVAPVAPVVPAAPTVAAPLLDIAADADDPEVTITAPETPPVDDLLEAEQVEPKSEMRVPLDPASDPAPAADEAIAAVDAAAGTDWMDESLQLGMIRHEVAATRADATVATTAGDPDPIESDIHPPADETPPMAPRPHGPPVFPGDDDITPAAPVARAPVAQPAAPARQPGPPLDRVVTARMCNDGHPNSPHAAHCRRCGADLDLDLATITVEQPTLAVIRLPDGSGVPVSGDVILGRNPSVEAARVDGATLVRLDAPSSVSRTHLSISVDGWRLLVTDCGSRAGSALVIDGEDEPITLEAWMPHEVNGGDRLFLGGPTALTIDEVPTT